MANYNKSFNFRNGVQVDSNNFIVNSTGLVGIGTSLPGNYLDVYGGSTVRGDSTVSGIVSSSNLYTTGISTILGSVGIGTTNITGGANLNNNAVLNAGIVTANYYYGSGLYLNDVVGFATEAWIIHQAIGGGPRSGISTTLSVGIGTTFANVDYDLVIGRDPVSLKGISFDGASGNVNASGIVTSTGGFIGTVSGRLYGDLTGEIYSTGVSTLTQLQVGTGVTIESGIGTFGHSLNTTNLTITGVSTFNDDVNFSGASYNALWDETESALHFNDNTKLTFGGSVGSYNGLEIYYDGVNTTYIKSPTTADNNLISVQASTGTTSRVEIGAGSYNAARFGYNSDGTVVDAILYHNGDEEFRTLDGGVYVPNKIGIGVTNPASDITIRRSTQSDLHVWSDTAESIVALGRSESLAGFNAQLRYGNTNASYDYSSPTSLDIINYGTGNINYYLNPNSLSELQYDYYWHRGSSQLMTLTGVGGSLGIGVTQPINPLHVSGIATFSTDVYIGGTLSVLGDVEVTGNNIYNLKGDILSPNGVTILDSGTGDGEDAIINANVNMSTGISTMFKVQSDYIGINTHPDEIGNNIFQVYQSHTHKFFVNDENQVGVRTDRTYGEGSSRVSLNVSGPLIASAVGVGTTMPRSTSDFQHAANANATEIHFMMPPKVTLAQRNDFKVRNNDGSWSTGTPKGAMVYNTDDDMMQVYDGTQWQNLWS